MSARDRPADGKDYIKKQAPWASDVFGPTLAFGDEQALASPAHDLQMALASEYEPHPLPEVRKWHPAATLGFILVVCGGFWTAVGLAVAFLL